jgi:hypothetical protein
LRDHSQREEDGQPAATVDQSLAQGGAVLTIQKVAAHIESRLPTAIAGRKRYEYGPAPGGGRTPFPQGHEIVNTELCTSAGELNCHAPLAGTHLLSESRRILPRDLVRHYRASLPVRKLVERRRYGVTVLLPDRFFFGLHRIS